MWCATWVTLQLTWLARYREISRIFAFLAQYLRISMFLIVPNTMGLAKVVSSWSQISTSLHLFHYTPLHSSTYVIPISKNVSNTMSILNNVIGSLEQIFWYLTNRAECTFAWHKEKQISTCKISTKVSHNVTGGSLIFYIFTTIWDVAGGGLFLRWPLANTLIVSIRNVHVARNCY